MIDDTIIGFTDIDELRYLEKLASDLPRNSVMVEVGAFLGRTAFVLAATRPDCQLFIYDPFDANVSAWIAPPANVRGDRARYHGENQFDAFVKSMRGCNNYFPVAERSPPASMFSPFSVPVLVFIDAEHHYDGIRADLEYWSRYVTDDTALCGHDYCEEFDDVRRAVNDFATARGLVVHVEPGTTIWKFERMVLRDVA